VRWTAAAVVAAIALALSACGDELEEFRDDLHPLEERADERRSTIAVELRTLTLGSDSDARVLRAQTAALEEIFDEIAGLEPPDSYQEPFADYVRANDSMVRGLERFAAAAAAADAQELRRLGRRVVDELSQSQSARLRWLE
jgi:hypothetical protein